MTAARRTLLLLSLVAAATVAVAEPGAAGAAKAKGCAQAIIADWFDNNRIDKIYKPLTCYRDAIRALPTDVKEYTDAAEDIRRAWALARKGKPDTGPTTGAGEGETGENGVATGGSGPGGAGPGGSAADPGTGGTGGQAAGDPGSSGGEDPLGVSTGETSSVPIPLLVLAALAGLLLLAGGAGYLSRRRGDRIDAEAGRDPA